MGTESDISFGLHYSCQSPDEEWQSLYQETLSQVKLAETLEYETIEVAEHHFLPDGWVSAPMVLLGGIAAVTDDMTVQTGITVLPLHHPVEMAEQSAIVDILSGGNFRLGVAIGWRDAEFEAFGIDKRERAPRTEEGIEIVRSLLTERSVSYDGEFYQLDDVTVMPRPVQESVPILYGGMSPPAIDRSARLADAWLMSPIEDKEELAEEVEVYRDALDRHNRSYEEVHKPLRREAYVGASDEEAWDDVWESILYEYTEVYGDYEDADHKFSADPDKEGVIDELKAHADDRFIIGGPETVVEELEEYREITDTDEFLLRMHFPGLDPSKTEASIRRLASDVMPHFE